MRAPVLIVGGAGTFGSRLAERLARRGFPLILAGRTRERAEAVARDLRGLVPGAAVDAAVIDRDKPDPAALRATGAFCVVDAAGPFQTSGLALPEAVIASGLHYVDLADGRAFVNGIVRLDAAAREAGVLVAAGASSVPALTGAVLDDLAPAFASIDTIEATLSPGNRAPRGLSVVKAILEWAGAPVKVFRDGAWTTAPGFGLTRRVTMPRIGHRWASLADVPDLDIVPARHRPTRSAIMRAGLELSVLHLGLVAASFARRLGLVASLAPIAGPARAAADLFRWFGSDRGGLTIEVVGTDHEGRPARRRWWLLAERGDGPHVPVLAAAALVRALAEGRVAARGAMPAVGLVSAAEILAEAEGLAITTGTDEPDPGAASLYARILGSAFARLPAPIRGLHAADGPARWRGRGTVTPGANPLARLAGRLAGFPGALADVPLEVILERDGPRETWRRVFAAHRFRSRMGPDPRSPYRLEEWFGPLAFAMRLEGDGAGLSMHLEAWRLGPIPLPAALLPRVVAVERLDQEGRFTFLVEIALPLLGRMVRYEGWLVPA